MAAGTDTYMGLAVPIRGHSKIQGTSTATDVLTVDGASGASGDILVLSVAGTEKFVVNYDGSIETAIVADAGITTSALSATGVIEGAAGLRIAAGKHLRFSTPITTAPAGATGWTKGDVFIAIPSSGIPCLGIATASTPTIYYIMPNTQTFTYSSMPK